MSGKRKVHFLPSWRHDGRTSCGMYSSKIARATNILEDVTCKICRDGRPPNTPLQNYAWQRSRALGAIAMMVACRKSVYATLGWTDTVPVDNQQVLIDAINYWYGEKKAKENDKRALELAELSAEP